MSTFFTHGIIASLDCVGQNNRSGSN